MLSYFFPWLLLSLLFFFLSHKLHKNWRDNTLGNVPSSETWGYDLRIPIPPNRISTTICISNSSFGRNGDRWIPGVHWPDVLADSRELMRDTVPELRLMSNWARHLLSLCTLHKHIYMHRHRVTWTLTLHSLKHMSNRERDRERGR